MTRIAICAPATPITREHADALRTLVAEEFPEHRVCFHEQCFDSLGHFAGADVVRMEALVDCANDESFDAVWFAKGGYGSNRIAEQSIEKFKPAARQKSYVGFSDCGYLLGALYRHGIGQSVHGSMPVSARSERGREAVRRVLRWFSGDLAGLEPGLDDRPVAAFNLITLAMMIGTPLMPNLKDHVVIVEEVSEHLYSIDRIFFHLMPNLAAQGVAGIRLGAVTAVPENERPFGQEPEDIARFWCARAGVAYLGRAEIGHTAENRIVPFGVARAPLRS